MWYFGYSDLISGDGPVDVFYGACSSFMEAVETLYDHVEKESVEAESYQDEFYAQVLSAIRAVMDNPDIRYNSDAWVDTTFTDKIGEIEYMVTFVK